MKQNDNFLESLATLPFAREHGSNIGCTLSTYFHSHHFNPLFIAMNIIKLGQKQSKNPCDHINSSTNK